MRISIDRLLVIITTFAVLFLPLHFAKAQHPGTARPILDPATVPPWFATGKFRSARWDGGPIEAEKALLSHWDNYTEDDPRQVLQATRDWYNPKTIDLLRTAHINWAWVTWSTGFSPSHEKQQWDIVSRYIQMCHEHQIRVAAYISIGNMFWKEMFEDLPGSLAWVERDFQGAPLFYGRPNRYMADIRNPEWIDLQRLRVTAAVHAGADALWIDNTFSYYGAENVAHLIDVLYGEAAKINPHFVIMSNYNQRIYTWGRLQNAVTTEDGLEPGYYRDKQPPYIVTNAGLLRYNYGVGEGWRPVSVEDFGRNSGDRMTTPMEPEKWQLAIAECAMYHASLEINPEGLYLRNLYFADPRALEGLRAIGAYNAFLETNESFYTHPQSLARVAILSDETDFIVPYLNELSQRNLNYDVIFNYQAPSDLKNYKVVVLPNTNPLSPGWCRALSRWVQDEGGALISVQDAAIFPPAAVSADHRFGLETLFGFSARSLPASKQVLSRGKGSVVYLPQLPPADVMFSLIQQSLRRGELVEVERREAVVSNVAYQPREQRVILHLLNYRQHLERALHIRVHGVVDNVEIHSPDAIEDTHATIRVKGVESEITIPELETYDLVSIHLTQVLASPQTTSSNLNREPLERRRPK
jgi:hypothetical protein